MFDRIAPPSRRCQGLGWFTGPISALAASEGVAAPKLAALSLIVYWCGLHRFYATVGFVHAIVCAESTDEDAVTCSLSATSCA